MSFSYDSELLTPLNRVRRALSDVDPDNPLLSDEEYGAWIAASGETSAIISAAEALALAFAQEPGRYTDVDGGTTVDYRTRAQQFADIATTYRTMGSPTASASLGHYAVGTTLAGDVAKLRTREHMGAWNNRYGSPFTQ